MRRWLLVAHDRISPGARTYIDELRLAQCVVANTSAEIGDDVLLWRYGQGGGLVAVGVIINTTQIKESDRSFKIHSYSRARNRDDLKYADIEIREFFASRPVSPDALYHIGLINIWYEARRRANSSGSVAENSALGELSSVDLSEKEWQELMDEIANKKRNVEWPAAWNIQPGAVVRRTQLHSLLGGSRRTSCSPSAKTPNIFLFLPSSRSGEAMAYWDGDVLVAPGHFQWDKELSHENITLLNHAWRGRPLRVFEASVDDALYLGEFLVDVNKPIERWELTGEEKWRKNPFDTNVGHMKKRGFPLVRLNSLSGFKWSFEKDPFAEPARVELGLHLTVTDKPQDESYGYNRVANMGHSTEIANSVQSALSRLEHDPEIAKVIGAMDEAQTLAALVQHVRRQSDISALRSSVENSSTTEHDLQKHLDQMTWIFGGEFISRTRRRAFTVQDELDISLVRPDGTLHGVEIKKSYIPTLVKKQRNHLIVGREVNEAVGQAMNYLRSLDEQYHRILVEFGVDCRRASMTVLIGYTPFADTQVSIEEIDEAIRTYNSHMTRIRVMTYDHLLDSAQRVLDLTEPVANSPENDH